MKLSMVYSKTAKGARALESKSKSLSPNDASILSRINGKISIGEIMGKVNKLSEDEVEKILSNLQKEGFINLPESELDDDTVTRLDIVKPIEVAEISAEEFLRLDTTPPPPPPAPVVDAFPVTHAPELLIPQKVTPPDVVSREQKAREEAEMKARILAEQRAIEEEIARTRAAAEAKVKSAIDREAEDKAKQIAEEKARIEAEQQALEAEMARSRAEAEAKSRRAAEIAKFEAEKAARELAERKAKEEAARLAKEEEERKQREKKEREEAERLAREAEKAKIEAERKAREEAERKAKEEEKARLEAERKLREEAERKAREEEERKRREQKEREEEERKVREAEKARIEAERKAREEEERRARAEEKARLDAERKAREDEERKIREEEKARIEAERRLEREIEAAAKAEAKRIAREEAEEKARIKAEEKARIRAERGPFDINKFLDEVKSKLRIAAISIAVLAAFTLILLGTMDLTMLKAPMEKIATDSIGEPVSINGIHVSLWPQPNLTLSEVVIGKSADIQTSNVRISTNLSSFYNDTKLLSSIEFNELNLEENVMQRAGNWINTSNKLGKVKVAEISVKKSTIKLNGISTAPIDALIKLDGSGKTENISINNEKNNFHVTIAPQNGSYKVNINASNWDSAIGAPLVFDELRAEGTASHNHIALDQIEGELYGGKLKAALTLDWGQSWTATGNFQLDKVQLQDAALVFNEKISMKGHLNTTASFSSEATEVAKLADAPEIDASFEASEGFIGGIDLIRAIHNSGKGGPAGGSTNYDKLSGTLALKSGHYQYRQLLLDAGQLQANGEIDITPAQEVAGKVNAQLLIKSRPLQAKLTLMGRVGSINIKN